MLAERSTASRCRDMLGVPHIGARAVIAAGLFIMLTTSFDLHRLEYISRIVFVQFKVDSEHGIVNRPALQFSRPNWICTRSGIMSVDH